MKRINYCCWEVKAKKSKKWIADCIHAIAGYCTLVNIHPGRKIQAMSAIHEKMRKFHKGSHVDFLQQIKEFIFAEVFLD